LSRAEKGIGDVLIFPVRTIGIGFEKDILTKANKKNNSLVNQSIDKFGSPPPLVEEALI
jgi:hypothetical protein